MYSTSGLGYSPASLFQHMSTAVIKIKTSLEAPHMPVFHCQRVPQSYLLISSSLGLLPLVSLCILQAAVSLQFFTLKECQILAKLQWLMPVILATWEAEIWRIMV
jgi:hypothetical protein